MSSLWARWGRFEAQAAVQTIRGNGKRKRRESACLECRGATVQRRWYGDDSVRLPGDAFLFPPHEGRHQNISDNSRQYQLRPPATQWKSWYRRAQGSNTQAPAMKPATPERDRMSTNESQQEALWERFEQFEDANAQFEPAHGDLAAPPWSADDVDGDADASPFATHAERDSPLLDIDYTDVLPDALQRGDADLTARCLFAAARAEDQTFIASIAQDVFSQILKVMEPANRVSNLSSAHTDLSNAVAQQLGIASMPEVAWEYSRVLRDIRAIRRRAKCPLTPADYVVLLRSARDLGHGDMAVRLFNNMLADGYAPTTEHWNHHMAAVLFDRRHESVARHTSRVVPFHMLARRLPNAGPQYAYRVGAGGIKDKILTLFSQMLKDGTPANEETFSIVMIAAAREGELGVVKSVLRKVWKIDVDALAEGTDEAEILPTPLSKDSPQYPTSRLLFTIAHAFGINNDIPTALRLVDFVARHYKLTISQGTWAQLFEWTFVLASVRTGRHAQQHRVGQLPKQSVMNLWNTMTGAPYFVQPTMAMYNRLVKNLFTREMSPAILDKMEEGRQIHIQSIERCRKLWTALRAGVILSKRQRRHGVEDSLEQLRSDWEHADLIRRRNAFWLKRWLRLLLATMRSYSRFDPSFDMAFRTIPRLLWEWRAFAPTRVQYDTVGGIIEFDIRGAHDMDVNAVHRARHQATQQKWLKDAPRYVGHSWVVTEQARVPRRVQKIRNRSVAVASAPGGRAGSGKTRKVDRLPSGSPWTKRAVMDR